MLNDCVVLGKSKTIESTAGKTYFMVIWIITTFSNRKHKDYVRATWMPLGDLKDFNIIVKSLNQ